MAVINLGRIQPIDRGLYNPAYQYKKLDLVSNSTNSVYYTCILDTPSAGIPLSNTTYFRPVISSVGNTFNTLTDLKNSTNVSIGDKVRTLGYTSVGDGGGNDYEIVAAATGTDDGGTYIDLTGSGNQAKGLFADNTVSVKQFGKTDNSLSSITGVVGVNDGDTLTLLGYHSEDESSSVTYRWDSSKAKADHDGGMVIDPSITFPVTWSGAYLDPVNVGTGCWVISESGPIKVSWYGAKGDDTNDDTNSIKKWVLAGQTYKRELYGDVNGKCKTTETIYLPTETILRTNAGGRNGQGFTLKAYHTGAAVVSLKGAVGVYWDVLNLETDATIFPKTGICLGRDTAASAGHHKLEFTRFQGYASVAAIYSIASEVNYWDDMYVWLLGGGALHTFYTSEQDDFAVDSLVKSTNIQGTFNQAYLLNASSDVDSSCFYCEMGPNTGDWKFNGYLIPTGGSYARLNVSVANFPEAPTVQPFVPGSMVFRFGGERLGPTGNPLYGMRLTTDTPVKLKNFGFTDSRFDFQAGADKYQLFIDSDYILETPNVVLGPPEAFAYALVSFNPQKILGGIFSVDRLSQWEDMTLDGTWIDSVGGPYPAASYSIDGFRNVNLRGRVSGGTGLITTLPYGPQANILINCVFGEPPSMSFGTVLIETNGNVSQQGGTGTVDLSTISFRI